MPRLLLIIGGAVLALTFILRAVWVGSASPDGDRPVPEENWQLPVPGDRGAEAAQALAVLESLWPYGGGAADDGGAEEAPPVTFRLVGITYRGEVPAAVFVTSEGGLLRVASGQRLQEFGEVVEIGTNEVRVASDGELITYRIHGESPTPPSQQEDQA